MSAWDEYKKKIGKTTPFDLLQPDKYGDEQTAKTRYEICLQCPKLIQVTKQCKECGCFMQLKVKLREATCPIGKW